MFPFLSHGYGDFDSTGAGFCVGFTARVFKQKKRLVYAIQAILRFETQSTVEKQF